MQGVSQRMVAVFLRFLIIALLQKPGLTTAPCDGYVCGDGSCVIGTRCDGVAQCDDGSDEIRCERQSCPQFYCNSGATLCGNKCNKIRDCDDGSDEERCCYECDGYDAVLGGHGRICSRACNGITECDDGSDEQNCPPATQLPVAVVVLSSVVCGLLFVIGCSAAVIFIIVYSVCNASNRQRHN